MSARDNQTDIAKAGVLLFTSLKSVRLAGLIFLAVPMAASGGILALWLRGMPFSISAGVGFIAMLSWRGMT